MGEEPTLSHNRKVSTNSPSPMIDNSNNASMRRKNRETSMTRKPLKICSKKKKTRFLQPADKRRQMRGRET